MSDSKTKLTPLSELGEFGLIERITRNFPIHHSSTIKSVGDDAALLDYRGKLVVVTTDLLVEGIHFDLVYTPLLHLGYKAVVVNLSDVYAMNATPKQITVSVALSGKFSLEAVDMLYDGIRKACQHYDVDLIGGDTSSSVTGLTISITALGEVNQEDVVYRNSARVGDMICVSGDLGAAYAGLQILRREKEVFLVNPNSQPEMESYDYVLERQLKPEARRDIIQQLKEAGIKPTSMIDVSDGLSSEILHICTQSHAGAKINEEQIPVDSQTVAVAQEFSMDPTLFAMNGGEDYELLFTIAPADLKKLNQIKGISIIGEILSADQGIKLLGRAGGSTPIQAQGWNAYQR